MVVAMEVVVVMVVVVVVAAAHYIVVILFRIVDEDPLFGTVLLGA